MQGPLSGDDGDQADCQMFTDFSQESITPIFRVKKSEQSKVLERFYL